jgi:large subunit ribosomal protein L17
MITLAKRDTLHARRQAASYLLKPEAVKKLFEQLGPRFNERPGGYTRILKLGTRKGDGAETALIEFLGTEVKRKAEERRKRREERIKAQQEAGEEVEEDEK